MSNITLDNSQADNSILKSEMESTFHILAGIIGFITLFGIPSNLLVIVVFRRIYRQSPTTMNLLIISTTVSDFFLIFYAGPVHTYMYVKRNWTMGYFGCQFYGFWVHMTSVASLTHLVVISVERYLIIKNKKKNDQRPFRHQLIFVSLAWGYAIFWSLLPFFGWSSYVLEGLHTGCAPKWVSRDFVDVSYNITLMVTEFILPLIIIVVSYVKLFSTIKHHNESLSATHKSEAAIKRGKVVLKSTTRIIIMMVGAYVFSWLPYSLICAWAMIVGKQAFPKLAAAVPALFAKSCVMWNPLIYGMKHIAFKNEIKVMWADYWRRLERQVQPSSQDEERKA